MANSIPRAEHPNPQFERESWLNLNGEWEFEIDNSVSGRERGLQNAEHLSSKIIVPFCPESRLSGVENTDFMNCVWYRRDIEISESELEGIVILHFGAVDYDATVYINGEEAMHHKGGYVSFAGDITKFLKAGKNFIHKILQVYFFTLIIYNSVCFLNSGNEVFGFIIEPKEYISELV